MSWTEFKVRGLREEAEGILGLELCLPDGAPLPFRWEPGAHVDLRLGDDLIRQYSLTNLPDEGCMRLAIKHAEHSRGGSRWLHRNLRLGDRISVAPPRNLFPLEEDAERVVLVAAGIGVTPLLSMFRHRQRQARPVQLLYYARSPAHLAFAELLEQDPAAAVYTGLSGAEIAGHLADQLPAWQPGSHLYTCGPEGFMACAWQVASDAGWPSDALHREYFQAPMPAQDKHAGVELVLARSGKKVRIAPGETLVSAAQRVGVDIPTSCGMGMCGACMTKVIRGVPEHHDQYLSDIERAGGEWIMPCVSGCHGDILELDR